MAARSPDVAADVRAVSARFPFREIATVIAVVFTATGAMLAGMQWTVSNNLAPLFLAMQSVESRTLSISEDVDLVRTDVRVLRGEVEVLRGEVEVVRGEVAEVRAEVAENRAAIGELRGLRAEVAENRRQIVDLRERVARVETGLEQVQANQVRMLEILERRPDPRE